MNINTLPLNPNLIGYVDFIKSEVMNMNPSRKDTYPWSNLLKVAYPLKYYPRQSG